MGRNAGGVLNSPHKKYHTPNSVVTEEGKVRGNSVEVGMVFDERGRLIKKVAGTTDNVDLGFIPKNSIVSHTHPANTSFSFRDIQTAVHFDVAEIRAVGNTYSYSLIRPKNGWKIVTLQDDIRMSRIMNKAYNEAKQDVNIYYQNGYRNGVNTRTEAANLLLHHIKMKKFAKALGWKYTKHRLL